MAASFILGWNLGSANRQGRYDGMRATLDSSIRNSLYDGDVNAAISELDDLMIMYIEGASGRHHCLIIPNTRELASIGVREARASLARHPARMRGQAK